jgi:hypothetical protein
MFAPPAGECGLPPSLAVWVQVHWLRIIVDEGHSLGASLGLTNKLAMAVQLTAQRRWVMTGTPTPATSAGGGWLPVWGMESVGGAGGGI